MFPVRASVYKRWRGCTKFYGWFCRKTVPDYKKFTETFFKAEIISEYRYLVKDVDVETGKEFIHRHYTQEDAWNDALRCANRQTNDLSVKMPGEYYGAAEPPVRCGKSHLSGLTEPPHFVY